MISDTERTERHFAASAKSPAAPHPNAGRQIEPVGLSIDEIRLILLEILG